MNTNNYFTIDKNGFFISENPNHCYDLKLNNFLIKTLKGKSILDIGCGDCSYLKNLKTVGSTVFGYDGNPYTKQISDGIGDVADISALQDFKICDWVISFEVGEHIPKELENNFISNICNHAKEGVIISWAIEGQPGEGHINCRNNDYVIDRFYEKNFLCDFLQSNNLRNIVDTWWFQTNLLIFYRIDYLIK